MKKFVLLIACLIAAGASIAQTIRYDRQLVSGSEYPNDIKIAYARHFSNITHFGDDAILFDNTVSLEYDRFLLEHFELGAYGGIRFYESYQVVGNDIDAANPAAYLPDGAEPSSNLGILFGLVTNIHLLPPAVYGFQPFEAYVTGKFGGSMVDKLRFSYGAGLGVRYSLLRHWGLFAEVLYGNSVLYVLSNGDRNPSRVQARFGLTAKF